MDCHICGNEGAWTREITYPGGAYGGHICGDPDCQEEADTDASDDGAVDAVDEVIGWRLDRWDSPSSFMDDEGWG